MRDAGLAHDYWKKYHTAEEVEEALAAATTTMIPSGVYPVHVRLFLQPGPAPTVMMGSSVLSYGLHLLRAQLPMYRAGFNVMQFDFPGLGQSGGPRGGCTVGDFIQSWHDAIKYAVTRFGQPLYIMGVGEDGVTGYYAAAGMPETIRAISVHNLFEYGERDSLQGQGPYWLVRAKAVALAGATAARPTTGMPGPKSVPWEWIYGGTGDDEMITLLENDPLSLQTIQFRLMNSIVQRMPAAVQFESCRTPVQVIASSENKVCPYDLVKRNYERLGGPKELVTLDGKPQWEMNREFNEVYCAHVIRWFKMHGAQPHQSAAKPTTASTKSTR
ncbi:MAG TPA: alpha/beta hydrolase [Thermomicrobiales bacterium]|nr:alpha/beta hydrolase [Thermomicrobiales bacterium]